MAELPHWLGQRAYLSPNRLAVISGEVSWTFQDLATHALAVGYDLERLGIQPGQRVALLVGNRASTVALIHALSYVGAVAVLLNTRLTGPELRAQISDSGSIRLIYDAAYKELAALLGDIVGLVASEDLGRGEPLRHPAAMIDLAADQGLIYTSGTTGRAKGVRLSYANHWWSATASGLNLGIHDDDRWLVCLPLFHVSGLSVLFRSVIYGMPMVLHSRFDPDAVNRAIDDERVTMISVVSTMLQQMLKQRTARYPRWLRCVLVGGGPVPLGLLEACRQLSVPVYQTYGLTETASQIVTLSPEYAQSHPESAGKPLFGASLAIRSEAKPTPSGAVGEIFVRGPMVTQGYFEQAAVADLDGWLATGDLGYIDDEGLLYVLDRRQDLIVSGGENVYPAEVEAALGQHPDVEAAGVVSRADPTWGQVPVAFVELAAGVEYSETRLRTFLVGRLAGYKIPKQIWTIDQLPRTASGKLKRRDLSGRLVAFERGPDED